MIAKKRIMLVLLCSLIVLVIPFHNLTISQENNSRIIILYSIVQEKDVVENILITNYPNAVNTSVNIANFNSTLLDSQDVLIILGTTNFALSTDNQTSILNFSNLSKKSIISFTPFIGQFNNSLSSYLGISEYNDTYPTGGPENWNIELNTQLGNLTQGTALSYSGQVGVFNKSQNSETIASIINSSSLIPEIAQLNYPLPAIINTSTADNQVIFGSISPIPISSGDLKLNQIPIFKNLISEIIVDAIRYHNSINQPIPSSSNGGSTTSEVSSVTSSPSTTDIPSSQVLTPSKDSPSINSFIWLIIIGILALIVLFRRQILKMLRWIEEKTFGIIIGIIGSVYKVQNRFLDTNQVLINQNRSRILDYLEFLAGSGAHFREIKSVVNLGTGILLWHLQVLEEFGLITQYRIGRYNIFVAYEFNEEFNLERKKLEIKFRSKYAQAIFENLIIIEGTDKLNISEFAKRSSVDRKTTKKHLEILERENIIKLEKTSYGVEIVKINKTKIQELLRRLRLKEQYISDKVN